MTSSPVSLFGMRNQRKLLYLLVLAVLFFLSSAYATQQHKESKIGYSEFYSLIDQMERLTGHKTFYKLLDVTSDASQKEIATAFHKLSMKWHPDKSTYPNASEVYPLLGTVSKILRDQDVGGSKERYDWILNEAPHWHRSAYQVKRMVTAKVTLVQIVVFALIFTHVAQVVCALAKYFVEVIHFRSAQVTINKLGEKEQKRLARKYGDGSLVSSNDDVYVAAYLATKKPPSRPRILDSLWMVSLACSVFEVVKKSVLQCCCLSKSKGEIKKD